MQNINYINKCILFFNQKCVFILFIKYKSVLMSYIKRYYLNSSTFLFT